MRVLEALLTLFALSFALLGVDADAQMMRLDADTHFLLPEVAVVTGPAPEDEQEETGPEGVHVLRALPEAARPEAYRSVDLRQGDVLIMMNGKRLREAPELRQLYEELEVGAEVKLAVQRDADRFFVRFPKADEETLAQGGMRIIRRGPGAEPDEPAPPGAHSVRMEIDGDFDRMEPALGLGVVLGETAASEETQAGSRRVEVAAVLPIGETSLEQGDVLRAFSGETVESLDGLLALLETAADGETLALEIERGGETLKVEMPKIAAEGAITFRGAP